MTTPVATARGTRRAMRETNGWSRAARVPATRIQPITRWAAVTTASRASVAPNMATLRTAERAEIRRRSRWTGSGGADAAMSVQYRPVADAPQVREVDLDWRSIAWVM